MLGDSDELMALAAGLLGGNRGFGGNLSQGLLSSMDVRNKNKREAETQKQRDVQNQIAQMQLQQMQQAQQQEQQRMQTLQTMPNFRDPRQGMQSLAPTQENATTLAAQKPPTPYEEAIKRAEYLEGKGLSKDAQTYYTRAEKLKPQQKVVGSSLLEVGDSGVKELYRDPMAGMNSLMVPGPDGKPMVNQPLLGAKQQIARAGKADVTTNVLPAKDTFKNSLTLKKDFDDQPEVKAFKEVRGAWDQISTALKSPSAANDLAAATKFMKLLDPGSVVRESELILAMQATGKLDQFLNTANRITTGQKLTPQQRIDFHNSGEQLFNAARGRFDQTTQQYQGIAKQYGLDSQFIPKESQKPNATIDELVKKYGG